MITRMIEVVVLLFCIVGVSQSPNSTSQGSYDSSAHQTVAMLMADNGQAPIPGFFQTLVSQLGDDAALDVMQYLGERKATVAEDSVSPQEISRILDIVHMAFAVPGDHPTGNRVPKATLVLLKYLSCLPSASSEKENLANTSKFVEQLKQSATTPRR